MFQNLRQGAGILSGTGFVQGGTGFFNPLPIPVFPALPSEMNSGMSLNVLLVVTLVILVTIIL